MSEEDYLAVIDELLLAFPSEEVEPYLKQLLSAHSTLVEFSLHPLPNRPLTYHPVPLMLSGMVKGIIPQCELIKFGRDLHNTRSLNRTIKLRRDLRRNLKDYLRTDWSDFSAKIFELEILAEFYRAGINIEKRNDTGGPDFLVRMDSKNIYIEAKHRSAPKGMVVATKIMLGLGFREFGEIRVRLDGQTLSSESVENLSSIILSEISCLIGHNTDNDANVHCVHTTSGSITHSPAGGPRSIIVRFGKETYEADLKSMINSMLMDKEKQLLRVANKSDHSLVAIDFRSLLWGIPEAPGHGFHEDVFNRILSLRTSIIEAIQAFLRSSEVVSGVLCWWRKADVSLTVEDRIFWPDLISMVTENDEDVITSASDLRNVCLSL